MSKNKDPELPILVNKADGKFRISAQTITSLAGNGRQLTIQHKVGRKGAITIVQAMADFGLRDKYLKKQTELRKKWAGDPEGFGMEDSMWLKHFSSQAKGALKRVQDEWERFYLTQDLLPCATWLPSGDKKAGSLFSIWAMIEVSSRKLAVGTDADYAKYLWCIKRQTQPSADKNRTVTADTAEYLKMGHASKDVSHFLSGILKGDIPSEPPPALGFQK